MMTEDRLPDLALYPEDPDWLITEFARRVPDVLHAVAVTSDGVLVAASHEMQPGDLEQLSAITAGMTGLACTAAEMLDNGAVIQALVTMERGTLAIMAIDDGSSLAVLTTAAADLDTVAYEMTMLVEDSGTVFAPPRRRAVRDAAHGTRGQPGKAPLPQRRRD